TTIGGTLTATTVNLTDTTDAASITFNGNVTATTLNTAAEAYNVIFNGTTSTITNAVTFSNSGYVTFGNSSSDLFNMYGASSGFTVIAPSQVNLAGTLQTNNGNMILGDADTPLVLVENTTLNTAGTGTITIGGTINGAKTLSISNTTSTTINGVIGGTTPITSISTNTNGTTYINSGAITTTGSQAYSDAVVLGADTTLTTTNNVVSFSSTVDSDSTSPKRDLTLTLGSSTGSFSGIVGTTSLADIILNSSATFNAAVTADNLTIAASKTATVKGDVTIASNITLSGYSTLAVDNASAVTIAGTIVDSGDSNTISVNDSTASAAPDEANFTGTVAADSLTVGTSTTAGKAKFSGSGGATITSVTVTGGDHANEDSTATFDYALTSTDITLDDNTGSSKIIFAEDNSVTIAGTIDGASAGEGTLQVTGTL
ncbi:MAG: hypothetical protein EBW40_11325, partial [Gammaproteobacteria bacterium]|nr:hypothetical protein [Gammaproteobacteria bacterium]